MATHRDAQEILRGHVYRKDQEYNHTEAWRNLPELPTVQEIRGNVDGARDINNEPEEWNRYQQEIPYEIDLPHNIVEGPWTSNDQYLGAHYQILREDACASLRRAVDTFRSNPNMDEDDKVFIYTDVCLVGYKISRQGPAARITFSTDRSGKRINWEQSKRLVAGTIVALTPCSDRFASECHVAVVAARPVEDGLDQNPPTIELFWADINAIDLNIERKYFMIEARDGYFESSRHMLVAIQKLMTETFSLANHIVRLDKEITAPDHIEVNPYLDLTPLENLDHSAYGNHTPNTSLFYVDVNEGFPTDLNTSLDNSQLKACKNMLTKKVAIVQGPPGTGKTFVSVSALKVMIKNLGPNEPPIIVSAQTNHALDQLLNHVLKFEESIVRLGGRSDKENKEIRKRTLYELGNSNQRVPGSGLANGPKKEWESCVARLEQTLEEHLHPGLITSDTLVKLKIITEGQQKSLEGDDDWGQGGIDPKDDIQTWLGGQVKNVDKTEQVNMGLPLEEEDEDFKKVKELEDDLNPDADGLEKTNDTEALFGRYIPFRRQLTARTSRKVVRVNKWKKLLSKTENLYEIPLDDRGELYKHFEQEVDAITLHEFREDCRRLDRAVKELKIATDMRRVKLCKHLGIKVVGCTTTGLSKYRRLLSALGPRTLLIEEAAETQEGMVIGGMMDSIDQLILVGDHQQLQANCNVASLLEAPYHLSMSMFERLVNNNMEYVMLNRQRRMIPEIRQLLCIGDKPFYTDLHDHDFVTDRVINRPSVPGMHLDSYFFNHNWSESRDADGSCFNQDEADFIVNYFHYLTLNGTPAEKITILTFYNGQRKTLLKMLRNHHGTKKYTYFSVFTVDSYQGEENDVILLSLVRSNGTFGVGFLDNRNRVVVALSRARRGLYLFGNAHTLSGAETTEELFGREPLWRPLIEHFKRSNRLHPHRGIPVVCQRHQRLSWKKFPDDFVHTAGGCQMPCDIEGLLPCGHKCTHKCHPFDHAETLCNSACEKKLSCGDGCSMYCFEVCFCLKCGGRDPNQWIEEPIGPEPPPKRKAWFPEVQPQQHLTDYAALSSNYVRNDLNYRGQTSMDQMPTGRGQSVQEKRRSGVSANDAHGFSRTSVEPKYASKNDRLLRQGNSANAGIQEWNDFDARAQDRTAAEYNTRKTFNTTTGSRTTPPIFEESYKPIKVVDGQRQVFKARQNIIAPVHNTVNGQDGPLEYQMVMATQELSGRPRQFQSPPVISPVSIATGENARLMKLAGLGESSASQNINALLTAQTSAFQANSYGQRDPQVPRDYPMNTQAARRQLPGNSYNRPGPQVLRDYTVVDESSKDDKDEKKAADRVEEQPWMLGGPRTEAQSEINKTVEGLRGLRVDRKVPEPSVVDDEENLINFD